MTGKCAITEGGAFLDWSEFGRDVWPEEVSHLAQSRRMLMSTLSLFREIALIIAHRAGTDQLGEARWNTLFALVNWGCREIHNCTSHRHFSVLPIKTNKMVYDVLYKIELKWQHAKQ